jgi:hypothetical protein
MVYASCRSRPLWARNTSHRSCTFLYPWLFRKADYFSNQEWRTGCRVLRRPVDDGFSCATTGVELHSRCVGYRTGPSPSRSLGRKRLHRCFRDEDTVRAISPDFAKLQELDLQGVIVTAPGADVDFVSRFFAPKIGIPEDPVTGAAHCELTPYWAQRLGKTSFEARQVSPRGGRLSCQLQGNRVVLSGRAVTFMIAEIDLGD